MTAPRIVTAAERAARRQQPMRGNSVPMAPVAAFRKKGCKSCKPIPVYSKHINLPYTKQTLNP